MATSQSKTKQLWKTRRPLPASWRKAAGILRGKKKALERHVQATRNEWR